ncbi:MAG: MFS transporter [Steroidobacteraceae bacterium]
MGGLRTSLPRTVVVLGFVSLLNDAASEMITPLLPIFLTATLGAGPAIVGLVEGLAEATSSVLKLVAGRLADRGVPAKRLVLGGYGIANVARPLIGLATGWAAVLLLRFLDRVGKGLRSAPRDALIAGAVGAADRGRAFGFHRSMDHFGAVVGPLLAFALLSMQADLKNVFLASVVPGVLVMLLLWLGLPHDGPKVAVPAPPRLEWRALHGRLRAMIVAAGVLALASVPEAFVVLWAHDRGLAVAWVPLVWAAASLVKMGLAMPAGILSDRVGRVPVLLGGWAARVAVLLALATSNPGALGVWALFLAYAATLAVTEPAERSVIGDHAATAERGTAFGLYHLASGLMALPGAVLFGLVWERCGSGAAFAAAAAVTAVGAACMVWLGREARAMR